MAKVLITVDTELSAGRQARGVSVADNFASSIEGRCDAGCFGIGWQMDRLDAAGLKGVYFVDPMPALVHGIGVIADIVGPIVARGHDVQLHVHTEWLEWAKASPVGDRQGRDLADFDLDDQVALLRRARDLLIEAGAPPPVAFRAGNYGANDDSLRALHTLGMRWDTSFNPAYFGTSCRIGLSEGQVAPVMRHGVVELPVAGFSDRPGHFRPAQICAISAAEMRAVLAHAGQIAHPGLVIVTHSFEMLSRDRLRPNRAVMARFEAMCDAIAGDPRLESATFPNLDFVQTDPLERFASNPVRTAARMAEQAIATLRYERGA